MYKVIIVDDERNIINNISSGTNWGEYGFELAGIFTSATDALEFMKSNEVNLIISDIKMPGTDGLEFAKITKEKFPNAIFVIISAYAEFGYAQKALSLGVSDYIVKPITYSKISDVLQKASKQLENLAMLSPRSQSDKHKVANKLITQKYSNPSEAVYDFAKCKIIVDESRTPFATVRISVPEYEKYLKETWIYEPSTFQNAFSFVAESDNPRTIVTKHGYGYLEMMIIGSDFDDFISFLNNIFSSIINNCYEMLNCIAECEIIRIYRNIKELFYTNAGSFITLVVPEEITNSILSGNALNACELMKKHLKLYDSDSINLRSFFCCYVAKINTFCDIDKISSKFSISALMTADDESVKQAILDITDKASIYFCTNEKNVKNLVSLAKDYINEHYSEELSLSSISKALFVSESHISRTFKSKTSESIISYIARVRLEHARELLLRSNLSVDEICFKVGYKSRNLFFKNFKDTYNVTPKVFRQENRGNE